VVSTLLTFCYCVCHIF